MEKVNIVPVHRTGRITLIDVEALDFFEVRKGGYDFHHVMPKKGHLLVVKFSGTSNTPHKHNGEYYIVSENCLRKSRDSCEYSLHFRAFFLSNDGQLTVATSLPIPALHLLADPSYREMVA